MNSITQIDLAVTQFINTMLPHTPFFDSFFSFLSLRGASIVIWIAVLIALFILIGKKQRSFAIYFTASLFITLFAVNIFLKNAVRRPRPTLLAYTLTCPRDYSFPSGHASTAFAVATAITFFDKKRRWLYYSIASLVALSRIYLGCHYMFDVVIGAAIGSFISTMLFMNRKVSRSTTRRTPLP